MSSLSTIMSMQSIRMYNAMNTENVKLLALITRQVHFYKLEHTGSFV